MLMLSCLVDHVIIFTWSTRRESVATASAKRLYRNNRMEDNNRYCPGQTTMISAPFVLLKQGCVKIIGENIIAINKWKLFDFCFMLIANDKKYENTNITPENVLFPGLSGSIPFQLPRIRTVIKKKDNSDFHSQSRNCLGAVHRWARFLKTIEESFPKTIPLWWPKNEVLCNGKR